MFIGSKAKFVTAHGAVTNSSFGVPTIKERPSGKRYRRGQVDAVGLIGRNLRKSKEQEREGSWSTATHRSVRRKGHGLYRGLFIETSAVHLPSVLGCTCDFPPISAHSDRDYST
jgi:hypothetical protein